MNFQSWYTDTVDVFRVRAVTEHGLTRHERTQVLSAVPCRVYRSDSRALQTEQTAAYVRQEDHLMLDNAVDIRAGDELHIRRGALLGRRPRNSGPLPRSQTGTLNPLERCSPVWRTRRSACCSRSV